MNIEDTVDGMKRAMDAENARFAAEAEAIARNELAKELFVRLASSTGNYIFSVDKNNNMIVLPLNTLRAMKTYAKECADVWFEG